MAADRSDDARYLREKARQFRELAKTYKTEISGKLAEIARDLEARADEIERGKSRAAAARPERRFSTNASRPRPPHPR